MGLCEVGELCKCLDKTKKTKNDGEKTGIAKMGCGVLGIAMILGMFASCGSNGDKSQNTETPTTTEVTTSAEVQETVTSQAPDRTDVMPWFHSIFGANPSEILIEDPTLWYGYVSDAYIDDTNQMHVLLQVDRKADKELGKRAAKAIALLVKDSNDPLVQNVSYVITEDGAGVVIKSESVDR